MKKHRGYVEFLGGLRGRESAPFYLFTGTDDFLKKEAVRKLSDLFVPAEARALNYQSFLAGDCDWNDVETACLSSGLFSGKRVIVLIGIELMGEGGVSAFLDYARAPCEDTCLIAVSSGVRQESRRKGVASLRRIVRVLGRMPGAYSFWQDNRGDCEAWARDWLADEGKRMNKTLLSQILESSGYLSYEVWNVLEKALGLVGGRADITAEDIAFLGGSASVGSMNRFRMAVAAADRDGAHRNAAKCLEASVAPTRLLWMLGSSLRDALRSSENSTGSEVPRRDKPVTEALARRFSAAQMCQAIFLVCETEKGVKSGMFEPKLALEVLINELTG